MGQARRLLGVTLLPAAAPGGGGGGGCQLALAVVQLLANPFEWMHSELPALGLSTAGLWTERGLKAHAAPQAALSALNLLGCGSLVCFGSLYL